MAVLGQTDLNTAVCGAVYRNCINSIKTNQLTDKHTEGLG